MCHKVKKELKEKKKGKKKDHKEIIIIDHAETVKSLSQKELYWYHKLKTHAPFGLMNMMFTLHVRQGSLFIV